MFVMKSFLPAISFYETNICMKNVYWKELYSNEKNHYLSNLQSPTLINPLVSFLSYLSTLQTKLLIVRNFFFFPIKSNISIWKDPSLISPEQAELEPGNYLNKHLMARGSFIKW